MAHVCSVEMAEAIGFHWAAKPGMFSSGTEYMLEGAVQQILNMFRVNCEVKSSLEVLIKDSNSLVGRFHYRNFHFIRN